MAEPKLPRGKIIQLHPGTTALHSGHSRRVSQELLAQYSGLRVALYRAKQAAGIFEQEKELERMSRKIKRWIRAGAEVEPGLFTAHIFPQSRKATEYARLVVR